LRHRNRKGRAAIHLSPPSIPGPWRQRSAPGSTAAGPRPRPVCPAPPRALCDFIIRKQRSWFWNFRGHSIFDAPGTSTHPDSPQSTATPHRFVPLTRLHRQHRFREGEGGGGGRLTHRTGPLVPHFGVPSAVSRLPQISLHQSNQRCSDTLSSFPPPPPASGALTPAPRWSPWAEGPLTPPPEGPGTIAPRTVFRRTGPGPLPRLDRALAENRPPARGPHQGGMGGGPEAGSGSNKIFFCNFVS